MELTIKTSFSVVDYNVAVYAIADGFFDDKEEYSPALGKINSIAVFYNLCVEEDTPDTAKIKDLTEVDRLIQDRDFMSEYNKALVDNENVKLNFGNAYADAMKIVDEKKGLHNTIIKFFGECAESIAHEISGIKSDDIDRVANTLIAANMPIQDISENTED